MIRPDWWCVVHDTALAQLSSDWRKLSELKASAGVGTVAFDDLVVAGVAERRDIPLMVGSICRGTRTEFRLVGGAA